MGRYVMLRSLWLLAVAAAAVEVRLVEAVVVVGLAVLSKPQHRFRLEPTLLLLVLVQQEKLVMVIQATRVFLTKLLLLVVAAAAVQMILVKMVALAVVLGEHPMSSV
jgi:hypothetical protein